MKKQCWGSVTFWCGSGSADPYLWLLDPDPYPYPASFFSDLKMQKNIFFSLFFSYNWNTGTLSSVLKIKFLLKFCAKILFCNHYLRKGKDPNPQLRIMDPDPDPGGQKTCGSCGSQSGSQTLWRSLKTVEIKVFLNFVCMFVSIFQAEA